MPHRHRATTLWLSFALVLTTAALYAPVRHYAFLNYDDTLYVSENPHVKTGFSRDGIVWAWTGTQVGNWHPLTMLSHMLDCQLFGLDPGAHHLSSVVLHILNTLLLFAFLSSATGAPWRSACVAGLFALHPLHVESVAWIAERKDVLSTFFWMLTMLAYLHYIRQPRGRRYAWLLLAYTAALLSKPMAVTLPFVLLLLDVWPLRRFEGRGSKGAEEQRSGGAEERGNRGGRWMLIIEKLPLLLLAGICSTVTVITQLHSGAVVPAAWSPLSQRAANAVHSYALYLLQTFWPTGLAIVYPYEASLPRWEVVAAAAALAGITVLVLLLARRRPYLLVGWLWYLGTLVPVSGLVRIGNSPRADRYTYVPLIGIFMIAAWGVPDLLRGWHYRRAVCTVAAVSVLLACCVLTARQLAFWQDSITLFAHALAVTQNNEVAHFKIGAALTNAGRRQEAAAHFSAATRLDHEVARRNLLAELDTHPDSAALHVALGRMLIELGNTDEAVVHYREASRLEPGSAALHNNLAIALEKAGQLDQAIVQYGEGVRLEPQRAESHCNLAAALASAGRLPEAIEEFRAAIELQPQLIEARFGLATAYAQAGQPRAALAELDQLLRERPNWTAVETSLAWILATADEASGRDGARAVQLAEDAVQRTERHDADALNSLAAAYAAVGRFDAAVAAAQEAFELARVTGRAPLATALAERLTRYRAGEGSGDGTAAARPAPSGSASGQLHSNVPDEERPGQSD